MGRLGYIGLLSGFSRVYRPSTRLCSYDGNYPPENVLDSGRRQLFNVMLNILEELEQRAQSILTASVKELLQKYNLSANAPNAKSCTLNPGNFS